jgi:hypothetical protein
VAEIRILGLGCALLHRGGADITAVLIYIRFWGKADIGESSLNVCF